MRVLITGGCGFIGSNLARLLNGLGHEVVVVDDLSTGFSRNLRDLPVRVVVASILDDAALWACVQGADAVVHLAALGSVQRSVANPIRSHEVNVNGTLAVLEAARKSGAHVVFSSSSSVYGSVRDLPRTESLATRPMSPYGASKLAAESYCLAYGESYALPVLAFRFFNVYGPGQASGHSYAAAIPVFINAALKSMPVPLDGDGLQTRDFTYVDDVTRVLADAIERRVTSDTPVNLAHGTCVTLRDVLRELERILGKELTIETRPSRIADVRASQSLPTLFNKLFPNAKMTPFGLGLEATVEWFLSSGKYI